MISHKYKCIFIHIPKTGGTTIKEILLKNDPESEGAEKHILTAKEAKKFNLPKNKINTATTHFFAKEHKKMIPKNIWDSYFKFAFVRNPWDLAVSHYFFKKKSKGDDDLTKEVLKSESFSDFIREQELRFNSSKHLYKNPGPKLVPSQKEFLSDDNGNILVDFIGRFENFEKDLREVLKIIGIKINEIPKLNQTKNNPYLEYYNKESRENIRKMCWEDINFFCYFFNPKARFRNWLFLKLRNNLKRAIEFKKKIIKTPFTPKLLSKKLDYYLY